MNQITLCPTELRKLKALGTLQLRINGNKHIFNKVCLKLWINQTLPSIGMYFKLNKFKDISLPSNCGTNNSTKVSISMTLIYDHAASDGQKEPNI